MTNLVQAKSERYDYTTELDRMDNICWNPFWMAVYNQRKTRWIWW